VLILRDAWTRRPVHRHPYRWASTEPGDLLTAAAADELAGSFPDGGFVRRDESRRQDDKQYRNFTRVLVRPGSTPDDDLPAPWRRLVADLVGAEYRALIARLLAQEPADAVELRLVRHAAGDWLGPHTDREDKLFSHILYFNPGWREEWGGCLEVLDGDDSTAVAGRVVPRLGASALIVQAPNSWHQVSRVRGQDVPDRRSLLVHGYRG